MASIQELELLQARRGADVGLSTPILPPPNPKIPPLMSWSQLLAKDGGKAIPVRTGLTDEEFFEVLDLLEQQPEVIRRGRPLLELRIRLVILLQWVYHGQTFKKLGQSIGLTHSCVQTSITSIWNPLTTILFGAHIPATPLGYTSTRTFINYPAAGGALDATSSRLANHQKEKKIRDISVGNTGNMGSSFSC